jgi:hypothetical protein
MKTFFSGVAVVVLCCAGLRPGRQRNRENRRYCLGKQRGGALSHGPQWIRQTREIRRRALRSDTCWPQK